MGPICIVMACAAAVAGVRMNRFDRQLQQYRRPGAPESAFNFVPSRWRGELYTDEGLAYLEKVELSQMWLYVFGFLAIVAGLLGL